MSATLPRYEIGEDNSKPDFTNCPPGLAHASPSKPDQCTKVFDDGMTVVEVCAVDRWWRHKDMQVSCSTQVARGHYVRVYRKIADEGGYPQCLVLYQDGNVRLKPQPPKGRADTCFGSSVIVGPASPGSRPFIEIQHLVVMPSKNKVGLVACYGEQGDASMNVTVERGRALLDVRVGYSCDHDTPFATLRSMCVVERNCDVDHVQTRLGDLPILKWQRQKLDGPAWFFHRTARSRHNTSAPDLTIEVLE